MNNKFDHHLPAVARVTYYPTPPDLVMNNKFDTHLPAVARVTYSPTTRTC